MSTNVRPLMLVYCIDWLFVGLEENLASWMKNGP